MGFFANTRACYDTYMTFGAWLGIYIIFLAIFWFFVLTILRHFREYNLPNDYSKWIVRLLLAAVIMLNIFSILLFLNLFP